MLERWFRQYQKFQDLPAVLIPQKHQLPERACRQHHKSICSMHLTVGLPTCKVPFASGHLLSKTLQATKTVYEAPDEADGTLKCTILCNNEGDTQ